MKKFLGCLIIICGLAFGNIISGQVQVPLLNYPEFTDITLANGLRVLVAENHEQPAVVIQMLVKAGNRDEPRGKEGLAKIASALLDKGAGARNVDQIAEAIDNMGGKFSVATNDDYTTIGLDLLSQDIAAGLELFSSIIMKPTFPNKGLWQSKEQVAGEIIQDQTDPVYIGRVHANNLLFGPKNRMGRDKSIVGLMLISARDVKKFHHAYYCSNNSILLVIGDFSSQDMIKRITEQFGAWPSAEVPKREAAETLKQDGINFRLANKPGLTQGTIVIMEPGITSKDPDKPAYRLMDYILERGVFTSRMWKAVRSQGGKTYHIGSLVDYHQDLGVFGVYTATRNEEVVKTYNLIAAELKKMAEQGITEDELNSAKSFYLGYIPLLLESPRDTAERVLAGLYYGFTIDEMRRETRDLNNLTRDDVNRVAKKYLNPDSFVLVVVGDGKKIRKDLSSIGKFQEVNYKSRRDK